MKIEIGKLHKNLEYKRNKKRKCCIFKRSMIQYSRNVTLIHYIIVKGEKEELVMPEAGRLEELFIQELSPKLLEKVNEYLKSPAALEGLGEELREPVREQVEELFTDTDLQKKLIQQASPLIFNAAVKVVEDIGVSIKTIKIVTADDTVVRETTDSYHSIFEDVLFLVQGRIPVLLKGPAGSGKNYCAEQIARAIELPLYRCTSPQDKFEFEGFIDGYGKYHEKAFYKAFTQGGILLLDEMDNSFASALISVNDAICNGKFAFPDGEKTKHENFRVIATANTWGNGKNFEYIGRNKIDAATLDRFAALEYNYDKDLERLLYPDDDILEVFWALRESALKNQVRAIFSMRGIKYCYECKQRGMDLEKIVRAFIVKGLNIDDLNVLLRDVKIDEYKNQFYEALLTVRSEMTSNNQ